MRALAALGLGLACVYPQAASADAGADLQAKVIAALRAARALVETVTINPVMPFAPHGATITFTVVAPDRFRKQLVGGPDGNDDTIIIGHAAYGAQPGGGWDVQTWNDDLVKGYEGQVFAPTIVSAGSGTFTMVDPSSQKDTMDCTYDAATFRPTACKNARQSIVFSRYDDASVAIPTPENAKPAAP